MNESIKKTQFDTSDLRWVEGGNFDEARLPILVCRYFFRLHFIESLNSGSTRLLRQLQE